MPHFIERTLRKSGNVRLVHDNLTGSRPIKPGQQSEQSSLSGSGNAHNRNGFADSNVEIYVVKYAFVSYIVTHLSDCYHDGLYIFLAYTPDACQRSISKIQNPGVLDPNMIVARK